MAGSVEGAAVSIGTFTVPVKDNPMKNCINKAYMEGRSGSPAVNPHPAGSEAFQCYQNGNATAGLAARQYETAVP